MNKGLRKILAKEFIILIIVGLLILICYLVFNQLDKRKSNQVMIINGKIEVIERAGLQVLIKDFYAKYDADNYSKRQVILIQEKYGDSYKKLIQFFYNNYEPERYSDKKLQEIIDFYSLDNKEYLNIKTEEKQFKIDQLQSEIETIQSIDYKKDYLIGIFVILGLSYPIRFILYGLKWSIKTLKQE